MKIADLKHGDEDTTGAVIRTIYAFKPPEYAIYHANSRVIVQYADDRTLADRQRTMLVGVKNTTRWPKTSCPT